MPHGLGEVSELIADNEPLFATKAFMKEYACSRLHPTVLTSHYGVRTGRSESHIVGRAKDRGVL